jgi:hypothetical protein
MVAAPQSSWVDAGYGSSCASSAFRTGLAIPDADEDVIQVNTDT